MTLVRVNKDNLDEYEEFIKSILKVFFSTHQNGQRLKALGNLKQ